MLAKNVATKAGPPGVRGAWPARSRFEVLAGHLGWRKHHDSQPTLWQPRIGSGLSPQPPDRLANKVGTPLRKSGLPRPGQIYSLAQWVAIPAG